MQDFSIDIEVRWGDLDPNFHVLHSKYFDFGAYCRMYFLKKNGITVQLMKVHHINPIIFREECLFKREIQFGDEVRITLKLDKLSDDHRKWTMVHEIWLNNDMLAAQITCDGAWMDTNLRKVVSPPEAFKKGLDVIPKTDSFNQ